MFTRYLGLSAATCESSPRYIRILCPKQVDWLEKFPTGERNFENARSPFILRAMHKFPMNPVCRGNFVGNFAGIPRQSEPCEFASYALTHIEPMMIQASAYACANAYVLNHPYYVFAILQKLTFITPKSTVLGFCENNVLLMQ
jgi:hypothetical protein